jgi:sugar-specific transcriptional regulator TrmB
MNRLKNSSDVRNKIVMPQNEEALSNLRRLGLNQYAAKAFYALSVCGSSTAGELSERAELPRPRIYDVLRDLQDKGFVALKPGRPVRYAAMSVGEALRSLKKQRETDMHDELKKIDEVGKAISSSLKSSAPVSKVFAEEAVWTLQGKQTIYSKISSMISGAKEHVIISSTPEGVLSKVAAHGKELDAAKARGVKIRIVSPKALDGAQIADVHIKDVPTRLVLADDQALIFLTSDGTPNEDEVGVWMQSPHVVETFKQAIGKLK